jgi:hypothetical protein
MPPFFSFIQHFKLQIYLNSAHLPTDLDSLNGLCRPIGLSPK